MCNCVKEMDEALKEHNGRIGLAILLPANGSNRLRSRVLIRTEKVDAKKRKPVPAVMASFCPFCGESVEVTDAA